MFLNSSYKPSWRNGRSLLLSQLRNTESLGATPLPNKSYIWDCCKAIEFEKKIEIVLGDGRKMNVKFESKNMGTIVIEEFEPEQQNAPERQRMGWQMILDNFKTYVEQL